jgi:putative ABC transport system substrate-binding protein
VRDPGEIERAIAAFARQRNGGLIVTASQSSVTHRNLIISLASQHRLPDVYPFRYFAASGCLASCWPDPIDGHKRAAGYVDRILKGEKPADLPVQSPTNYALVISGSNREAESTDAPERGGLPRSSDEAGVMLVE